MRSFAADLRLAARSLGRSPGFLAVAVLSLALGIGPNTTAFSLANALLFRPLPVPRPEEVVGVFTSDYSGPAFGTSSYPDYLDLVASTRSFAGLAAHHMQPVSLSARGATERRTAELVSPNYFGVLGLPPALGRGFTREEGDPTHPTPVAVLSDALWRTRFGADPGVLGQRITVSGASFTVVGVGPAGFQGVWRGLPLDLWIPISALPLVDQGQNPMQRGSRSFLITGRLAAGATAAHAQGGLHLQGERMHREDPQQGTEVRGARRRLSLLDEPRMRILPPQARGAAIAGSLLLAGVMALVLLIACANLAGLLLARAASRRREIAIRRARGARRSDVVRQFTAESFLVVVIGGALGLLLTAWLARLIGAFEPPLPVPVRLEVPLDWHVPALALALSLLPAPGPALAPAPAAGSPALASAIKDDAGEGRIPRSRLRSLFIVGQVALSFVLLVTAGLFLRSLSRVRALDPGFGARRGAMATVDLSLNGYDESRGRALEASVLAAVRATPGIEAAAWTTAVPLALGGTSRRGTRIRGYIPQPGEDLEFPYAVVSPEYFATLQVPLARGRPFADTDQPGSPGVVIVSEAFARRFWPGRNPLEQAVSVQGDQGPWLTVVGVARDGKYQSLGETPQPFLYFPLAQEYWPVLTLVARTSGEPAAAERAVRAAFQAADRDLPVFNAQTLGDHLALTTLPQRIAGFVLAGLGSLALLLAALGLYGIVAFAVAQRTREIGIRVAIGAQARDVVGLMIRKGLTPVVGGLILGLAGAAGSTRLLAAFLTGVSPGDPLTFLAVVVIFSAVALLACWAPARRATRVDPLVALRSE